MVGLGNVDNASDVNKPVNTLMREAFDTKANQSDIHTKSYLDNTAVAWIYGLSNDAKHFITTGTNSLAIRCKTDGLEALTVSNSGVVSIASNLALQAEPQGITFKSDSASPYTMQSLFNNNQNSLTGLTGGEQLLTGSSVKCIKAGTNINLSSDPTSLTINVQGLTKSTVGLGNVDNTSDSLKPVSQATITALSAKANLSYVNTELAKKEDVFAVSQPLVKFVAQVNTNGVVTSVPKIKIKRNKHFEYC
jgi:hypothetical protein